MRAVRGWGVHVVAWTLVLGVLLALLAAVVVPRLLGASTYTVLTGSMQPTLTPGTLVVVRPTPEPAIGDVVTYQLESGRPVTVTHRVVGVATSLTGERLLVTRGDANGAEDPEPVRDVQVRGVVAYSVPYLGRVGGVLSERQRGAATLAVAGGLLLYAAAMFTSALRSRREADGSRVRERPEEPGRDEPARERVHGGRP